MLGESNSDGFSLKFDVFSSSYLCHLQPLRMQPTTLTPCRDIRSVQRDRCGGRTLVCFHHMCSDMRLQRHPCRCASLHFMSPSQPPVELRESCSDGLAQQREQVITVSLGAASPQRRVTRTLQRLFRGTSILLPVQSRDDELETFQRPSLQVFQDEGFSWNLTK